MVSSFPSIWYIIFEYSNINVLKPGNKLQFYFSRVIPRFNCQLSSVSAIRLNIKDRIQDVHGDICEISDERTDVRRNACSLDSVGNSLNDGKIYIKK